MEQEQPNKFLVPFAIVVAGALIAAAVYYGGEKAPSYTSRQEPSQENIEVKPVNQNEHILNGAMAELYVIEYSDFECPFCKVFHNTMHQVVAAYGDKVAWVYRQFPIPSLHSRAMNESEASECVAELGGNAAFWSFADKLFSTTQSNNSLDPAQLPILAQSVGVSTESFNTCLNSNKYEEAMKQSMQEAYEAGARGTPYSVIVDRDNDIKAIVNGSEPIDMIKAKIDAAL